MDLQAATSGSGTSVVVSAKARARGRVQVPDKARRRHENVKQGTGHEQGGIMLSVIVPTYNELENIRPLFERVLAVFEKLPGSAEILVMDDNSPDGTADEVRAVAEELGARDRVRVIVRHADRGLAPAVMDGFREAKGDILVVMDADLSHPPELLPKLLAPIRDGSAQVTVASRRVKGGGVSNWPLKRRLYSWLGGLPARPLVPVKDTTSGYFALKRECLEGVWWHGLPVAEYRPWSSPEDRHARLRLPSSGSLGSQFPTFTGTMLRYDCLRPSRVGTLVAPSPVPCVRIVIRVLRPRQTEAKLTGPPSAPGRCPGLLICQYPRSSGAVRTETVGSPEFPSRPCEHMPRSQTPVVTDGLTTFHSAQVVV